MYNIKVGRLEGGLVRYFRESGSDEFDPMFYFNELHNNGPTLFEEIGKGSLVETFEEYSTVGHGEYAYLFDGDWYVSPEGRQYLIGDWYVSAGRSGGGWQSQEGWLA